MSMRRAASCGQPRHESSVPRGARMTSDMGAVYPDGARSTGWPRLPGAGLARGGGGLLGDRFELGGDGHLPSLDVDVLGPGLVAGELSADLDVSKNQNRRGFAD